MEKTLFVVRVEFEVVVLAENEWRARDAAVEGIRHEKPTPDYVGANHIKGLEQIPKDWLQWPPFGEGDADRSCREIFEAS